MKKLIFSLCLYINAANTSNVLKGHSPLWDRADLDTSFSHFEKTSPQPEIKVHLIRIKRKQRLQTFA